MAKKWSLERMERNIRKNHPWMTERDIGEYLSMSHASDRRAFITSLEYYRKKNGKP